MQEKNEGTQSGSDLDIQLNRNPVFILLGAETSLRRGNFYGWTIDGPSSEEIAFRSAQDIIFGLISKMDDRYVPVWWKGRKD